MKNSRILHRRVIVMSEVFVKFQKKKKFGVVSGVGLGGQGRCEQRSEVFVKIQNNNFFWGRGSGWGGGGVRMDVNEELKFL